MASQARPLRMLFFPLMAPGHMLPALDMAKLFAARGAEVSIITTPANAAAAELSLAAHPSIRLLVLPFPSVAGTALPAGCENVSSLPSPDLESAFLSALSALEPSFDALLRSLLPDCVVTDMFLPWTCRAAERLGVPRLVFYGSNFFSQCAERSLRLHGTMESLPPDAASFVVPGLPHRIEMLAAQMRSYETSDPVFAELFRSMAEADAKTYGALMNSFYELEPDYVRYYRDVLRRRAWHVGPLSLCNKNAAEKSNRGTNASSHHHHRHEAYSKWLDARTPGSVVYVSFGSISFFSAAELREIALGLEASGRAFVWVVRNEHHEDWLPEGFEERNEKRGLIVRGWAPQILILNHASVGAFLTHCGWNSCLEGVAAGLPLVTWPLSADQFYNERLMVDVLGVGVAVGAKKYSMKPEERPVVAAEKIASAVGEVMGGGAEAEERRAKARELAAAAKRAVEEGGSSYKDVGSLIEELMAKRNAIAT
ncbi:scopoletin glucosyltransferase-like [Iris pallida]|uniref:Glycosyltransferase n=1 Tax=Iris pallida TaxID=29817 RepID=A0AAX6HBY9_IRIPA|nr:scopoletin glucosyltransferase-like [Iris pallida]